MGDLYNFLKSCHDHLEATEADFEHVVPFVLASNDGKQIVCYAEGLVAVQKGPVAAQKKRLIRGFALKGKGTLYTNVNRYWVDFELKPFDSHASSHVDVTIRVSANRIAIEVMGVAIVNPGFAPRYDITGSRIWAGVMYGLEETPADVPDPEHYPKTLWTLSLQQKKQPIIVPK